MPIFIAGLFLMLGFASGMEHNSYRDSVDVAMKACEASLPRGQECGWVVVATPQEKEVGL